VEKYERERPAVLYSNFECSYKKKTNTFIMKVGTMEIVGTINIENIKSGINQMKNSLESAKVQAKSLFGDMERLGSSVKGIGKTMAVAGTGFLASLVSLASVGPQTTTAIERIKFETFRLGITADSVVGPTINKLANDFGTLTDIVSSNKPWYEIISNLVSTALHFDELKKAMDVQIDAWKKGQDLGPIIWVIEIKKKVEEGLENILPKITITPETAEEMMWGGQRTMSSKLGEISSITTSGPGMTPEEAGMIFAENVTIQTSNPIRESD